jgi:hypothetical protein
MRQFMHAPLAAFSLAFAAVSLAGDFDGSKKLICAPVTVTECHPDEDCETGTPGAFGAPAFLTVDVANKAIIGPKRISPIQSLEKTDRQLLLQGTELGHAWSLALDSADGKMSLTLVDRQGAFVMFGSCTTY